MRKRRQKKTKEAKKQIYLIRNEQEITEIFDSFFSSSPTYVHEAQKKQQNKTPEQRKKNTDTFNDQQKNSQTKDFIVLFIKPTRE